MTIEELNKWCFKHHCTSQSDCDLCMKKAEQMRLIIWLD